MLTLLSSYEYPGVNIKKLQSSLLAKGIRIADDDPVFTLLAINEIVIGDELKKQRQAFNHVKREATTNTVQLWLGGMSISALSFGVGIFVAGPDAPVLKTVLGVLICLAIVILIAIQYPKKTDEDVDVPVVAPVFSTPTQQTSKVWSEEEFHKAANGCQKLSNRTRKACWDVLVKGDSRELASNNNGVHELQTSNALKQIQEQRAKARPSGGLVG